MAAGEGLLRFASQPVVEPFLALHVDRRLPSSMGAQQMAVAKSRVLRGGCLMVMLAYDDAIEAVDGDAPDGFEVAANENLDTGRWDSPHRLILRRVNDDTFWAAHYSKGLTEYQESDWFGHGYRGLEGAGVKFDQVWPQQVVTTVYVSRPPVESE